MKIVIAGCRDYNNYDDAKQFIDICINKLSNKGNIVILSGGARGADALGERYAKENCYQIERFPADWARYGRGAGIKRNQQMAKTCDIAICFWDMKSKGTKSMIDFLQKYKKPIFVKRISQFDAAQTHFQT